MRRIFTECVLTLMTGACAFGGVSWVCQGHTDVFTVLMMLCLCLLNLAFISLVLVDTLRSIPRINN